MVGLYGLFQPKWFCDSVIQCVVSWAVWYFRELLTQRKHSKELVMSFKKRRGEWNTRAYMEPLLGKNWLFWTIRMGFWWRTSAGNFWNAVYFLFWCICVKVCLVSKAFQKTNAPDLLCVPLSRLACWWKWRSFVQVLCQSLEFSFEMIKKMVLSGFSFSKTLSPQSFSNLPLIYTTDFRSIAICCFCWLYCEICKLQVLSALKIALEVCLRLTGKFK